MKLRPHFLLALLIASPAYTAGEAQFAKVRPVLATKCFSCHSHVANKSKGGLMLDSREAMLQGGNSGPAIVPGQPEKSLLIRAIGYADEDLQMPPKAKLSAADIA